MSYQYPECHFARHKKIDIVNTAVHDQIKDFIGLLIVLFTLIAG